MTYAAAAVERAMKLQEVIFRVLSGALTWLQAADILGIHPRSLRRWRARYERDGCWACSIGGAASPRAAKRPSPRCSGSCACIASATGRATGTPASTCATSTTSSGAITA